MPIAVTVAVAVVTLAVAGMIVAVLAVTDAVVVLLVLVVRLMATVGTVLRPVARRSTGHTDTQSQRARERHRHQALAEEVVARVVHCLSPCVAAPVAPTEGKSKGSGFSDRKFAES